MTSFGTGVPNDVDLMVRRPMTARALTGDGHPDGAPECGEGDPQKMGESAGSWNSPRVSGLALGLGYCQGAGTPPPAPLAMGWSTVAVESH